MSGYSKEGGASGTHSGSSSAGSAAGNVRQAFAGLSFDEKITTLIQIELDMIGDAVGSVVSAVTKAVDDIAGACAEHSAAGKADNAGQAQNN